MCCKLFPIPDLGLAAGEECEHAKAGIGCKIYKDRPNDCRKCECSYYQVEKAHVDLRPDNCGVIFEKATDTIFLGTIDENVTELSNVVLRQIESFLKEGYSVVLQHPKIGNPYIYYAAGRTAEDVWKELQER
jgi:hypothetical protein